MAKTSSDQAGALVQASLPVRGTKAARIMDDVPSSDKRRDRGVLAGVRDSLGGFDCRSVASAPRGRRRLPGRFLTPTAATGGGRFIIYDAEPVGPPPNLSRTLLAVEPVPESCIMGPKGWIEDLKLVETA